MAISVVVVVVGVHNVIELLVIAILWKHFRGVEIIFNVLSLSMNLSTLLLPLQLIYCGAMVDNRESSLLHLAVPVVLWVVLAFCSLNDLFDTI